MLVLQAEHPGNLLKIQSTQLKSSQQELCFNKTAHRERYYSLSEHQNLALVRTTGTREGECPVTHLLITYIYRGNDSFEVVMITLGSFKLESDIC